MTRFGMQEKDFQTLAQYIHDVIVEGKSVKEDVKAFRQQFLEMQYCFRCKEFDTVMEKLHQLI